MGKIVIIGIIGWWSRFNLYEQSLSSTLEGEDTTPIISLGQVKIGGLGCRGGIVNLDKPMGS